MKTPESGTTDIVLTVVEILRSASLQLFTNEELTQLHSATLDAINHFKVQPVRLRALKTPIDFIAKADNFIPKIVGVPEDSIAAFAYRPGMYPFYDRLYYAMPNTVDAFKAACGKYGSEYSTMRWNGYNSNRQQIAMAEYGYVLYGFASVLVDAQDAFVTNPDGTTNDFYLLQ